VEEAAAARHEAITRLVREQYERYPYPDLDPDEDPRGWTYTSMVDELAFGLWGGRRDPNELRILDAGCGTGSPVCQCKLRAPGAEVVAIDLSESSLDRARRRAARLGCDVEFHRMPIQRVAELGRTFDYVVSSGVLHHMPDPVEGLRALRSVLAPQGVLAIMVYGKWGRVPIYALQEALRLASDPARDIADHIALARRLTDSVPPWYPLSRAAFGFELRPGNDGGIVDLLLHVQDRSYDVPAVYAWLREAELALHSWFVPYDYEPASYVRDPALLRLFARMPEEERHASAELLNGAIAKHSFLAVRPEFERPAVETSDGRWRRLGARLTTLMGWGAIERSPDGERYTVPMSSLEPIGAPLALTRWQAELVTLISQAGGRTALGALADRPEVKGHMPQRDRTVRDAAVGELLDALLSRRGIALCEESSLP